MSTRDELIASLRLAANGAGSLKTDRGDYGLLDEAADALQAQGWRSIETAPKDGTEVLIWNDEGHEIASWGDHEDDGSDQPGHDEGWIGTFAFPGRSWGNSMQWEAQGQPSHWMPLPPPPTLGDPG